MTRILVVDDSLEIRVFLQSYGEMRNYRIVDVDNGLGALEELQSRKFDLIITDRRRPGDSIPGDEFVKKVREISPNIPIIVLSADSSNLPDEIVFLQKPAGVAEIDAAISNAMQR